MNGWPAQGYMGAGSMPGMGMGMMPYGSMPMSAPPMMGMGAGFPMMGQTGGFGASMMPGGFYPQQPQTASYMPQSIGGMGGYDFGSSAPLLGDMSMGSIYNRRYRDKNGRWRDHRYAHEDDSCCAVS